MKPTTVLITAAGSAAAPAALQSLRAHGCRVAACDLYPRAWNLTSTEADAFFQAVPATDAPAYLNQLEAEARRQGIDFILPLTDVEVDVLCGQKERFAAAGCTLCVPDAPAARLCRDKLAMTRAIEAAGICDTIPTFSPYGVEPRADAYPLLLKPLRGRSSQGKTVALDADAYHAALSQRRDYIAQPFLQGDIYTVDVARDRLGRTHCLARRELLRTPNGLGTTVRVLPGHPLEAVCERIAALAGVVGVVNMEFIVQPERAFFLEVNPRLSGGVGFSLAAGMDFPYWAVLCHQGEADARGSSVPPCGEVQDAHGSSVPLCGEVQGARGSSVPVCGEAQGARGSSVLLCGEAPADTRGSSVLLCGEGPADTRGSSVPPCGEAPSRGCLPPRPPVAPATFARRVTPIVTEN